MAIASAVMSTVGLQGHRAAFCAGSAIQSSRRSSHIEPHRIRASSAPSLPAPRARRDSLAFDQANAGSSVAEAREEDLPGRVAERVAAPVLMRGKWPLEVPPALWGVDLAHAGQACSGAV